MTDDAMKATADLLVAPGKGILAADESAPTIAKRFSTIGVESTQSARRSYREILFTTPGLGEHISGVILFDETIRQQTDDGVPFAKLLESVGIVPGIKVDKGITALAGFPDEVVTEGLDGLRDRFAEYYGLGARFAKWRAVIRIGPHRPTETCVAANAQALARYAALAQEAGLVPIVEPEVLMDGDHTLERCAEVTRETLHCVYHELDRHRVILEATLLKPNMVLPGNRFGAAVEDARIAEATLAVMRDSVPASVPGIVFLSGGQTDEEATARLSAINRHRRQPWQLSFSFGRALQAPVLHAWAGDDRNRAVAQTALLYRARLNGAARFGE